MTRKHLMVALVAWVLAGCSKPPYDQRTLTLATTTSTRDSGLLDVLIPMFEEESGIRIKVVAVGSGQALELGRRGDADVLLTHAPDAEQEFMRQGYGEECRPVMYNDFLLVGPEADPARVGEVVSIVDAFREIAHFQVPFVSRGDESGTHRKEETIWTMAGVQPAGIWYIQAGSGMGETLRMTDVKGAYTLTDRATFLTHSSKLRLKIAFEGDPLLRNDYSVIVVSSRKHPHVQRDAAGRFAEFLTSPGAKKAIQDFGSHGFSTP